MLTVGGLEPRVLGAAAVLAQEGVVRVQPQRPAAAAGGALSVQWATATQQPEAHVAVRGDRAGVAVWAGDDAGLVTGGCDHGEIVEGEPSPDRRAQRPGFDDRGVPAIAQVDQGGPAAVGRLREHLSPRVAAGLVAAGRVAAGRVAAGRVAAE